MAQYLVRRVLLMIPTLFFVALITFALAHATPGGPWDRNADRQLSDQVVANLDRYFGLDRPLHEQFLRYVANAARLDFGSSIQSNRPVRDIIGEGLPVTVQLGLQALLLALVVAVPLGVVSALHRNSLADYAGVLISTVGTTIPNFVLAVLLISLFGVTLRVLPFVGWGDGLDVRRMILPTALLALPAVAYFTRMTRAGVLDAIGQEYVRTARAKGLGERVVVLRHVLKNALIPVATVVGPSAAGLMAGSFVIEYIFSIPGIGRLYVRSIEARDYPVIMGTTLLYAFLVVVANLTVDLAYGALDPRVKLGQRR